MSTSCARLRNLFKTQKTAKITPAFTPRHKQDALTFIKQLSNTVDLEELASKFKHTAIESSDFRKRNRIYNTTIARLATAKRYTLIEDILETHKGFSNITHEGFAIRLITLYGKAEMFDHARKVFDELPELNCNRTVKSFNALLHAGVKSKRFDEVCDVFRDVPSRLSIELDVLSYNTIINALCKMGSLDEGLLMVDEMKASGLTPNVITFNTLLDAFYRERGYEGGEKIWGMMEEYRVGGNTRSNNLKLQALVNGGEFLKWVAMFETLASEGFKPDVSTYNVLIKGFCDNGILEEARKCYHALIESGGAPNKTTFSVLVPKFCESGDYELAFGLCKKMFKRNFAVEEGLLQLVVNELAKRSMIKEAKNLVELGKTNKFVQYSLALPPHNL